MILTGNVVEFVDHVFYEQGQHLPFYQAEENLPV